MNAGWAPLRERLIMRLNCCPQTNIGTFQVSLSILVTGRPGFQVFDSTGSFLSYINTSADPLYGPQGLALTSDGHVAVADSGNHCFKVYRYLQWTEAPLSRPAALASRAARGQTESCTVPAHLSAASWFHLHPFILSSLEVLAIICNAKCYCNSKIVCFFQFLPFSFKDELMPLCSLLIYQQNSCMWVFGDVLSGKGWRCSSI